VEYAGDLINQKTAKEKETDYSKDPDIGCYMYYFTHPSWWERMTAGHNFGKGPSND
jgi:hypothetical protein